MATKTKKIQCPYCNYEWETKSRMKFVSCPSCLNKVSLKPIRAITINEKGKVEEKYEE